MDKPASLSIKDFIIRKMSVKMNVPEALLESVINHEFQSALQAMTDCKSVEISGFGKFLFNDKKAVKKMEIMFLQKANLEKIINNESVTDKKRDSAKAKLKSLMQAIEILKPKINEA
jgi:nucleoid DNA-binding protein